MASLCNADKVNTCITCSSDSLSSLNVECEKTPATQPTGACSPEFGNDYCYVLVTKQKQPVEGWMWNSKSVYVDCRIYNTVFIIYPLGLNMICTFSYSQEVVAPRRLVVRSAPCLDQTMSLMRCMRCGGLSVTLMIVILWIQGQSDDSW